MGKVNYVTRIVTSPLEVDPRAWDALLDSQALSSPFMRHAYLAALHGSGSACADTGWAPHFITLMREDSSLNASSANSLAAGCVVYVKNHSYGEYVFDWAWANAYQQHGVAYYPKAVVAVPFTPVPGARLLALDTHARQALVSALLQWCKDTNVSSLHLLFGSDADIAACTHAGLMQRHTVQFHWTNTAVGYTDFETFLSTLTHEKRKKIRQERRKVHDAGVTFRCVQGRGISTADWDFFYQCYERTYLEHGNAPYLSRDFFHLMADSMPEHWLLFVAQRSGAPIASSLIALGSDFPNQASTRKVAYGRYWGALERVDCLHFEACYYQPLQWCLENGYQRFEGGAQGEHKMARALLPVKTSSAHWLAHPGFSQAVAHFLEQEDRGVATYLDDLGQRSPFRSQK